MRLLVANYHARPVGGVETYLRAILPLLSARVTTVAILTREGGDAGPLGVPVPGIDWLADAGDTPDALVRTALRWRPDVVYSHGLGDPAFEAALAARIPTVAFMHNYGASCASGSKCHAAPVASACARPLGAACLALWWPRQCGGRNPMTMVRMFAEARRRQAALRACRAVAVASRHMVAEMVQNGLPPDRVHCLPLFPTTHIPDDAPPTSRAFQGRILFVGRLTAVKGWRHLLDAWPVASAGLGRPLALTVAGDGPDRAAFEAECLRRNVQCQFLGWVAPSQLSAVMRAHDLLAVPSVWPEPFGLVGVEAGCVGLPAVAFAVGGIPEWLTPGVSGECAPGRAPDAAAFADALVRAASDPAHLQRLRVGAWETARRFSAGAHVDRLVALLRGAGTPTQEGSSGR